MAAFAEVPTPPEAVAGGQIEIGQALVEPLKALVQKLGGGPKEVAVAIPSQMALVRRLPMPKLPIKRIRALIEAQGQQFIPFYRDGATFDLVVTNPNLSPKEQEVLLVAVPTGLVHRLRTTLRAAGLSLQALDLDVLALFRAGVATGVLSDAVPSAVLDVGATRARIGVFAAGWPVVVRSMDVLPLVASAGESPAEARLVLPEEFVGEVGRTAEILLSQARVQQLGALLLTARWSSDEVIRLLGEELQADGRTTAEFAVVTAGQGSIPPGMALAFGLALAAVVKPYRLSLLPRASTDVHRQRRNAALLLVTAMLGIGTYGWFWYQDSLRLQSEQVRLAKEVTAHQAELAREKEVAALEARIREVAALEAAYRTTMPWTTLYPHLRGLLPEGVALQTVASSGTSLAISGQAPIPEDLAAFLQQLHTSELIAPPILSTYSNGGGSFSIATQLKLEGGKGK